MPWWAGVYKLSLHIATMTLSYQTCGHHICTVDVGDVKEEGLREVRQREGGEVEGERRAGLHVAFARSASDIRPQRHSAGWICLARAMDNEHYQMDQISHSLWE